jgi:transcriptional regulator with XRE-family HTH domain
LEKLPKSDWRGLIRKALDGSGLSRAEFARRAELDPRALRYYEKDGREPEPFALMKIFVLAAKSDQADLLKCLPSVVWPLAAKLCAFAETASKQGLDTSGILEGVLRSEITAPSPRSSFLGKQEEEPFLARQDVGIETAKEKERGHRGARRKTRRSKAS